jgi:hypothetical protein
MTATAATQCGSPFVQYGFPAVQCSRPAISATPTTPTIPQLTTLPDFFTSVLSFIQGIKVNGTPLFAPGSVYCSIKPDVDTEFPATPPPFALIEPGAFYPNGWDEGGGRFVKTLETTITIHVVVRNNLDIAFAANSVVTSTDPLVGLYQVIQSLIDGFEQAYVIDPATLAVQLTQLPTMSQISEPYRMTGAGEWVAASVPFDMLVTLYLTPNLNP